ncbi:MAG: nucleotide pyrophosphohydrolase [Anaerolineales bacterium]|nr:nucleotide pyrophosphohydrolase [Anaerolineales bacterium]
MDESERLDSQTTVLELREAIGHFVKERSWERYHTPKNLAMSIAIEAAEVMERFQWYTAEESVALVKDTEVCRDVADELADVVIYCLALSNQADIDLSSAIRAKLDRNMDRFPIGYDPT